MPIPKPEKGEARSNYVARCMRSSDMRSEFKDVKQRSAVCFQKWRERNGDRRGAR